MPGVVIGDDVEIGNDVLIYPNVTIYHRCKIGNRVIIHSGTVVGSDGFGFVPRPDGTYEKIPQVGIVGHIEIADRTTIAAQSGVSKSITEPGKVYFGYPAREHSVALRIEGAIRQLPELIKEFRELKEKFEKISPLLSNTKSYPSSSATSFIALKILS